MGKVTVLAQFGRLTLMITLMKTSPKLLIPSSKTFNKILNFSILPDQEDFFVAKFLSILQNSLYIHLLCSIFYVKIFHSDTSIRKSVNKQERLDEVVHAGKGIIMTRAFNFNAGPAALPEEVLLKAQQEWMNFGNSHMSVMELSHRSKEYGQIHEKASMLLRELMEIPNDYEILFLQGGASLQFTMVPMNLLAPDKPAGYILTGSWSEKALKEARKMGEAKIIASTKNVNYTQIPNLQDLNWDQHYSYVHITSNNTIYGTHFDSSL